MLQRVALVAASVLVTVAAAAPLSADQASNVSKDGAKKLTGSKDFLAHLREARSAMKDEELRQHVHDGKKATAPKMTPAQHTVEHDKEARQAMDDKDLHRMIAAQDMAADAAHFDELPPSGVRPTITASTRLPVPRNPDGSEDVGAWYRDRESRLAEAVMEERARKQDILDSLRDLHVKTDDSATRARLEKIAAHVRAMEPDFEGIAGVLAAKVREEANEDEETEEAAYARAGRGDSAQQQGEGMSNPGTAAFYAAQLAQSGLSVSQMNARALMNLQSQLEALKAHQRDQGEWLHQLYNSLVAGHFSVDAATQPQQEMLYGQGSPSFAYTNQFPNVYHSSAPASASIPTYYGSGGVSGDGDDGDGEMGADMGPQEDSASREGEGDQGSGPMQTEMALAASDSSNDETSARASAAQQMGVPLSATTAVPAPGNPGSYLVNIKEPRPTSWWRDAGSHPISSATSEDVIAEGGSDDNGVQEGAAADSSTRRPPLRSSTHPARFQTFKHTPGSMSSFRDSLKKAADTEKRNGALMHFVSAMAKHREQAESDARELNAAKAMAFAKSKQLHSAEAAKAQADDTKAQELKLKGHSEQLGRHRSKMEDLEKKVNEEEEELKKVEAELKARATAHK